MDKRTKKVIIGASVGVLAGAIAGILLAPKSGKETRAGIVNYIHEMKDTIADELSKAGEITKDIYNGIVAKIVEAYTLEKKITDEDAGDIRKQLDNSYDEIMKTIKGKKAIEIKKATK